MKKITKAVFPVAGLGSRFLPATKAQPKEMLPIVDKPLIQYAVEEAVAAGITDMVFITGRNKRAIEDHFDKAYELESELEAAGKTSCSTWCATSSRSTSTASLSASPSRWGWAMRCCAPARWSATTRSPCCWPTTSWTCRRRKVGDGADGRRVQHEGLPCWRCRTCRARRPASTASSAPRVPAGPRAGVTPSSRSRTRTARHPRWPWSAAMCCRPQIFEYLENLGKGAGGEIQLTDGIAALMQRERCWPTATRASASTAAPSSAT